MTVGICIKERILLKGFITDSYCDPDPVETAYQVSRGTNDNSKIEARKKVGIKSLVAKFTRVSAHLRTTFLVIKTLLKVFSTFLQAI